MSISDIPFLLRTTKNLQRDTKVRIGVKKITDDIWRDWIQHLAKLQQSVPIEAKKWYKMIPDLQTED